MKKKRLTESQREIIKFLARGHHIYIDERGKFQLSKVKKADGTFETAIAGHLHTGRQWRNEGAHMYRPTIEGFLDAHLLIGHFDKNQRPTWTLNDKNKEYADELKELQVESALGITRKVMNR